MTKIKNAKRTRVEGESFAFAKLVPSSHYMARWLPSPRALNNYVEKFESRVIVSPKYITVDFIHGRHYNLAWNAFQTQYLTEFVQTKDEYYLHLIRDVYSTLNYVDPESDEENKEVMSLIEFDLGSQHFRSLQYEDPHMDARGYTCQWTKIFKSLGIDLSEEKSILLSNVAKIDDSTLRQMGRYPDAQEPQTQGQPQDPQVQAYS
ncbi:hypothetical protein S245_040203 [Arachis hypogaea]